MSEIKRAAWLGCVTGGEHQCVLSGNCVESWRRADGYTVAAVVEVQPVLNALMKAHNKSEAEHEFDSDEIWKLIDQLEKAAQP